jgi:hypothetical protein
MKLAHRIARLLFLAVLALHGCGTNVVVGSSAEHDAAHGGEFSRLDGGDISCGGTICGSVDIGGPFGEQRPCCFGESQCGVLLSSACVELHAQGTADPRCPSLPPYEGCCRVDGTCGVIPGSNVFGCIDFAPLFPGVTMTRCAPRGTLRDQ